MQHTHEDFFELVRQRIAAKNYDELFSGGCCFHFAMRAHQKSIGSIAYVPTFGEPTKKAHVFVISTDGRAFDHNGYQEISALTNKFFGCFDGQHCLMTKDELMLEIAKRPFPPDLAEKVASIADEIIAKRA